ncbi:hypothetical protein D9M68_654570 [compost metagenome]
MQLRQRQARGLEFSKNGEMDIPHPVYLLVSQVADTGRVHRENTQPIALPYLHVNAVARHQPVESRLRKVAIVHGKIGDLGHAALLHEFARHGHHDDILVIVRARHLAQHRTGTRKLASRQ